MNRLLIALTIVIMASAPAWGTDDVVGRAMKFYEKRHYAEAILLLRSDLTSVEASRQGTANVVLGLSCLKNAQLHRELYQAALASSLDYLKKLAAARGAGRSRFVDLYLGDVLLAMGKAGEAAIYLEKFEATKGTDPRYRAIARVLIGLCRYREHEAGQAQELWAGIDANDPEVKAELAAAYSRVRLTGKQPAEMIDEALGSLKKSGKAPSMRMVTNALAVFAREGMTAKGLDLVKRSDLKAYSYRESFGKSKVLTFYEPELLDDLAMLYGEAAIGFLEKAATDVKTKEAAEFNLVQAHVLFGSPEKSATVAARVVSSPSTPPPFKDRTRVWQGAGLYRKNRATDAAAIWDELTRKQPFDPDLAAEILEVCSNLKIDCIKTAQLAAQAAERGEGKRYIALNGSLGAYYLGKLEYAKGLSYLEAARDKGNKNKIESNDPLLLVDLASAYYRIKKFSEALEIYFEMSKQFPEVRPIQEAMQGVYAVEHKSAGDVNIN